MTVRIPERAGAAYRVYNIGNDRPVELLRFIEVLEDVPGEDARGRTSCRCSPGTCRRLARTSSDLVRDVGYRPRTTVEEGVARFVEWYRAYYRTS